MRTKAENKKIADKVFNKIKTGEILSNRELVPPKNIKEIILKRFCEIIFDEFKKERVTVDRFAKRVGVSRSSMNYILNFHVDKITVDMCLDVAVILSEKNSEIKRSILRISLA